MPKLEKMGDEYKKEYILGLIERPVIYSFRRHFNNKPVLEIPLQISQDRSDQGAIFSFNATTLDYSKNERLAVGINPFASIEDIEQAIRIAVTQFQKTYSKDFPKHYPPTTQDNLTRLIIEKKIIPALDLMIIYEHAALFCGNKLRDYGKRSEILNIIQFNTNGRDKDWEDFALKSIKLNFIQWLRAKK